MLYDCIIIGAGPAGLSAAVQAKRLGLNALVLEKNRAGGQVFAANLIENYPGFPEGIAGCELASRFVEQAKRHGVEIKKECVVSVRKDEDIFTVKTSIDKIPPTPPLSKGGKVPCNDTLRTYTSKTIIVTCGLKPKRLGIEGEEERIGKNIFSYIDPSIVPHKGKDVMIIGSGDAAFDQAINFSKNAKSVSIMMKHDKPKCIPLLVERTMECGIKIKPCCEIKSLQDITADIAIVCIGKEPQMEFLSPELLNPTAAGMFWAGDCCRDKDRYIVIAAGDGIAAAIKVALHLPSFCKGGVRGG